VWVLANLEETKMKNVKLGDRVEIHVDTYPGRTFHGKVYVVKGAAASQFSLIPQDNATGNYTKVAQRIPLKISIENATDSTYLFPGMSAEVKIKVIE
jgi:membrane fusion protein (multidrug efflux system)